MLAYMDYIMWYSLLMGHRWPERMVCWDGFLKSSEKGAKHPSYSIIFLGFLPSFSVVYGGVRRPLPGVPPMPHRCGPWCKWRPRRGCRWGRTEAWDGNLFEKGNETWWVGKLNGFIKVLYALYNFIYLFVYVVLAPYGHRSRDMGIISY